MKIKNVVAGLALTLVASAGFAVGLGANSDVKVAKAEHAINIGDSGSIFLQLNTDSWKYTGSKIALYMFNNDVEKKAWGDFVTPSGSRFVEYSYDLDFTPAGCIAFRFDPAVETVGEWCFENYSSNPAIWSRTNDIDFNDVVWLGNNYPDSKWTESGAYALDAVVMGGASDDWKEATVSTKLSHVKVNKDDNLEVFGSVTLPAGTYFKTLKGGSAWCGAYSAYSAIESNFSGGGESNIHNVEAGKYEFYFDYDGESTYITDPAIAAADEFAQSFLSKTNGYCSAEVSSEVQAKLKGEYDALASIEGAQELFYGAEVKRGKDIDYGSFTCEALSRYVNMQEQKGYDDFLGLGVINPASPSTLYSSMIGGETSYTIIIVSIVAVSALALTTLLVFKKKKQK